MRERGEVAARADGALLRHVGVVMLIERIQERMDKAMRGTGISFREGEGAA